MSAHKNCYLYRSGEEIIISTCKDNEKAKRFNSNDLGYTTDSKGIKSVQDNEGNYYYLADDCRKIQ